MIHQLYHVGQHGDADLSYLPNWSPSGLPSYHDSDGSHAMSDAEIEETIEGFVDSACRAQQCGFDGIELFGAYHSIIEQFWVSWSNQREDRWGGSFENRMRFSVEIIERIRSRVGDDFIIGMAMSIDESQPVHYSVEDLKQIASYLDERKLVDYFTVGVGSYFESELIIPVFAYGEKLTVNYTEALKAWSNTRWCSRKGRSEHRKMPTIPLRPDRPIWSASCADKSPTRIWSTKALAGEEERIRGCISCNQQCWGRRSRDYWISCLVNPRPGANLNGVAISLQNQTSLKKFTVVGGGPAGLEVARVAAERGHQVKLFEATNNLGGNFALAGMQPRRGQITDLISWYLNELRRLNVTIEYNTYIEGDDIDASICDILVIATGSQPTRNRRSKIPAHHDQITGSRESQRRFGRRRHDTEYANW